MTPMTVGFAILGVLAGGLIALVVTRHYSRRAERVFGVDLYHLFQAIRGQLRTWAKKEGIEIDKVWPVPTQPESPADEQQYNSTAREREAEEVESLETVPAAEEISRGRAGRETDGDLMAQEIEALVRGTTGLIKKKISSATARVVEGYRKNQLWFLEVLVYRRLLKLVQNEVEDSARQIDIIYFSHFARLDYGPKDDIEPHFRSLAEHARERLKEMGIDVEQ